ncbi:E3 SUMO-protein ligase ZBED1-like [Macrobrachium rosenbergii]|uniref:E3 SUMO-protein ligase ZBED1-like n=1 Tax=Macrobrachium rosenbergii TaxID=79674 RepID=UPI0034D555A1
MEEWDISDKVQAIVTDNGANMVAGVRESGFKQIPCFAHLLNLVVQDSLNSSQSLGPIIQKCSTIVSFFHHSTKAMDKLKEIQQQLNVPEHKLINSVVTRWNSVFYKIQRILEQTQAVTTALCFLGKPTMCLDEDDLEKLKDGMTALQPFEEVTREISAQKYVSISKVIPLATLLLSTSADLAKNGNELASHLTQSCRTRFLNIEQNYPIAASTYLDPRFKSLPFKNSENARITKEKIIREFQSIRTTQGTLQVQEPGPLAAPTQKDRGIWSMFDQACERNKEERSSMADAHVEMRLYSEEQLLNRETDPLAWWKSREECLKVSSRLAKKYLGIVATSVPSERLFSQAGQLILDRRARIKPKNVNMVLFLNSYLKK